MHICIRKSCINRISFGKEYDPEQVSFLCIKCKKTFYQSSTGKIRFQRIKRFVIITVVFVIGLIIFYAIDIPSLFTSNKSPEKTMDNFFRAINNQNYAVAYTYSENDFWSPLSKFQSKDVWGTHSEISIVQISKKQYFSIYGATDILNVIYNTVINGKRESIERDFHLKQIDGKWKIVRMVFPKNPEVDAFKMEEVPQNSEDAVKKFLKYLDKGKFKKAHLLSANKDWGLEFEDFLKKWGCTANVLEMTTKKNESVSRYATDIVSSGYYLTDSCKGTNVSYKYFFHLRNNNGLWQIVKVTEPQ